MCMSLDYLPFRERGEEGRERERGEEGREREGGGERERERERERGSRTERNGETGVFLGLRGKEMSVLHLNRRLYV